MLDIILYRTEEKKIRDLIPCIQSFFVLQIVVLYPEKNISMIAYNFMCVYNKDKYNEDAKFVLQKATVVLAKNFVRKKPFRE